MSKMVGDLKKFGLPNVKNLKIETLKQGYGEVVCQLIDELVNMELYRREFEFLQPTFPEEDDQEESDNDPDRDNDDFTGKNEIINGIVIETHSLTSPTGFGSGKKQIARKSIRKEETKVNFFSLEEQKGLYDLAEQEEEI